MNRTLSRSRQEMGPGIFAFTPTGVGSIRSRRKDRPSLFDYDAPKGRLTYGKRSQPAARVAAALVQILISGDGKFIYAGNRLHDSIGIFSVGADGLTFSGRNGLTAIIHAASASTHQELSLLLQPARDNIAVFRVNRKPAV